ncbi:helix-turn-helix domain-containing protein [Plantactinospora alkalitolerans]|nr:helix-turn-helix transcriptional regulator [Plantactinospora alkalitolerans]
MQLEGAKKITQAELARLCGLSRQTIYRHLAPTVSIESLGRRCNPVHVGQMASSLGLSGSAHDRLVKTAVAAATPCWWDGRAYGADEHQNVFANFAYGACRCGEYQSHVIGGIAQTEAYALHRARAVTSDEAKVKSVVLGRMRRKERLYDEDFGYTLLLEELALTRRIAPTAVMIEQLEHLVDLARLPNINIRVLPRDPTSDDDDAPMAAGYAPQAPFLLYDYPDSPVTPEIAVIDSFKIDNHILTDRELVDLHANLFERLVSVALSDAETVTYIRKIAAQMGSAKPKTRKGSSCPT